MLFGIARRFICMTAIGLVSQVSADEYFVADISYQYASWTPSSMQLADSGSAGSSILNLRFDVSPTIPFVSELNYWFTPGARPDQKSQIEEGDQVVAFERLSGGLELPLTSRFLPRDSMYSAFYVDAEDMAFTGKSLADHPFSYSAFNSDMESISSGTYLQYLTSINSVGAGFKIHSGETSLTLGYERLEYRRPVFLGAQSGSGHSFVYDSVFKGGSIKMEMHGADYINDSSDYVLKIGMAFPISGDIRYSNNTTMNDVYGNEYVTGYFKGYLSVRYNKQISTYGKAYLGFDFERISFTTGDPDEEREEADVLTETIRAFGLGIELAYQDWPLPTSILSPLKDG